MKLCLWFLNSIGVVWDSTRRSFLYIWHFWYQFLIKCFLIKKRVLQSHHSLQFTVYFISVRQIVLVQWEQNKIDFPTHRKAEDFTGLRDHAQNTTNPTISLVVNNVIPYLINQLFWPPKTSIMYHLSEGTQPCPFPVMGNEHGQVTFVLIGWIFTQWLKYHMWLTLKIATKKYLNYRDRVFVARCTLYSCMSEFRLKW